MRKYNNNEKIMREILFYILSKLQQKIVW